MFISCFCSNESDGLFDVKSLLSCGDGSLFLFASVLVFLCFFCNVTFVFVSIANETQITWSTGHRFADWLAKRCSFDDLFNQMLICLLVGYLMQINIQEISNVTYEPNWIKLESHQKVWEHIENLRFKIQFKPGHCWIKFNMFSIQHFTQIDMLIISFEMKIALNDKNAH